MRLSVALFAAAALALPASAQASSRCQSPEADGLDFWVGTWDLEWDTANGTATGTNTITREQNGCVIQEQFAAETGFAGGSWSVLTPGGWRQTWVDNAGGYLLFTGVTDDDGRVTEMRQAPFENPQGQMQTNRMVWEDVTDESLVWRWQASLDDGATWADRWVIRYTRRD
jgi:hypothetical protein